MPKGYFLSEVDVANPQAYEAYRTRVLPTVEKFGGRFLVRGGEPKAIEGGGFASRVIVIEFDSPEKVMAWLIALNTKRLCQSGKPTPQRA